MRGRLRRIRQHSPQPRVLRLELANARAQGLQTTARVSVFGEEVEDALEQLLEIFRFLAHALKVSAPGRGEGARTLLDQIRERAPEPSTVYASRGSKLRIERPRERLEDDHAMSDTMAGVRGTSVLLALFLAGCARGEQTLYVATERPEALRITIDGKTSAQTLATFQAYPSVDLTKGATIVVESGGTLIEKRTLLPVKAGDDALYLVEGAPTLHLVDYKAIAGSVTRKGSQTGGHVLGAIQRSEVEIVPIDRISSRTAVFSKLSTIVGPNAKLVGGRFGPGNQKMPIFRVERVSPETIDPWDEIGPRVTHELGFDVLPGGQPASPAP
jgi:hypothetical protein